MRCTLTGCPDKPTEPPEGMIVDRCYICGEDIYVGESYYSFGGDMVHEECTSDYIRRYRVND